LAHGASWDCSLSALYAWKCTCTPPPAITQTLFPGFKVVALFYAPPGKQSSVSYGTGSTVGSAQATTFVTQTGLNYGGALAFAAGVSMDQSFTFSTSNVHTERFSKSDNVTLGLNNGTGAQDAPNHGYDTFWLWVNPRVDLTTSGVQLIEQKWSTSDGGPPVVIPFTVREIQGIDPVPSYKREKLNQDPALLATDGQKLLELDPFLDPAYQPDPRRFRKITRETIWGPDHAADPVPSANVAWTYSSGTDDSFSTSEAERTQIMVETGFDLFGLIRANARAGMSFGVTFTQSLTDSGQSTQAANVMLRSNTPCHAMDVDVYFDKAFNSFVAIPAAEYFCSSAKPGLALDASGNKLGSQRVTYRRASGELVETYTDAQGRYPIYEGP
jgi:hypothetical protein